MKRFKSLPNIYEPKHILTFVRETCNFINKQNVLMGLKVDEDNDSEDVMTDPANCPNSLIAGMENDINELMDELQEYYTSTDNKKELNRLKRIRKKYNSGK